MKYILLDTSFLVSCAEFKIDFFSELKRICNFNFEIAILDKVLEEIDKIINRGRKEGKMARLAKTILLTKRITVLPTAGRKSVDKILLEKAGDKYLVATQDAGLKKLLKKKKQPVIMIRQKKHLVLVKT